LVGLLNIAGLNIETLCLDIPDKVSFLRKAGQGTVNKVSFSPKNCPGTAHTGSPAQ